MLIVPPSTPDKSIQSSYGAPPSNNMFPSQSVIPQDTSFWYEPPPTVTFDIDVETFEFSGFSKSNLNSKSSVETQDDSDWEEIDTN